MGVLQINLYCTRIKKLEDLFFPRQKPDYNDVDRIKINTKVIRDKIDNYCSLSFFFLSVNG